MTITYPIIGSLSEENWALIPSDPGNSISIRVSDFEC